MERPKPIIQSLWIGNELSLLEQLCVASFIANGHEFHLYTYGDVRNVPEKAVVKDGNEIIPEKYLFSAHKGSWAAFSDWFRWSMLYKNGNFWVDTDTICLKPFVFDSDLVFGYESFK
ncbi:MAG: glycosyltransferase, partial [Chloroflexota bacterium]